MKKIILVLLITLTTLMANFVMKNDGTLTPTTDTQVTATTEPAATTKQARYTVIPGLYSFGTDTRAAYGGTVAPKILHVNTLVAGISNTDSTHGSFKWAVSQIFPRIVVFDISGVIDSNTPIQINNPYITIAGQTAPSNIVLNGYGLQVSSHDVLVQHLAVRNKAEATGKDGIGITSGSGDVYNVIIDHCSATWALDEQISVAETGNPVHDITIANSIMGEGIDPHAYGSLNYARNVAHIGNLYIHNYLRSPQFANTASGVIYNNLIYNWGHSACLIATLGHKTISYSGNYGIPGVDTTQVHELVRINSGVDDSDPGTSVTLYMGDNIKGADTYISGFDVQNASGIVYTKLSSPIDANGYVIQPASVTKDSVLANVGPRPSNRDAVDTRLINDVINGTGKMISAVPTIPSYRKISDAFVPVANPHDMYNSNYTNLEHQLHQLSVAVEK